MMRMMKKKRRQQILYRNSRLTYLLQDSLGEEEGGRGGIRFVWGPKLT